MLGVSLLTAISQYCAKEASIVAIHLELAVLADGSGCDHWDGVKTATQSNSKPKSLRFDAIPTELGAALPCAVACP